MIQLQDVSGTSMERVECTYYGACLPEVFLVNASRSRGLTPGKLPPLRVGVQLLFLAQQFAKFRGYVRVDHSRQSDNSLSGENGR